MTAIVGDLAVRIGADISGFKQGLGEATRGADSFAGKVRAGAGNMAAYGAAAAAAGAAVAAAFVAKGMQAVDAQADLAAQLKTTSASMAILKRAGDLSGASMEQITTAGKRLSVVLGEADAANKKAAETMDRLGLSASAVAAMPLDERISAINTAIKETIPVTQQAAVAAELFGKNAGFAVSQINSEALAQAKHEAELFGLAISEVDAAKVQQAADEFGKIEMLGEGIVQQLTVNMAPAITAIMRMFTETAEEAGGVGTAVAKGANIGIDAIGFVMDAVAGLKRVFEVVGKAIAVGFLYLKQSALAFADTIVNAPVNAANLLIATLNKIPGINIEPVGLTELGKTLRAGWQEAYAAIKLGEEDIRETLARPLPSGKFKQYVEEAKIAAEEAAKVSQAITGGGDTTTGDPTKDKAAGEKGDPEAAYTADRLQRLREANMSELQILEDKQMQEIEAINAGWEQKLLTDESWNVLMQETKQRHEDEMTAIEQRAADARAKIAEAEAQKKQQIMSSALSGLTTLMNSENRKMFEIGKAAAIAQSIISTYAGMTKALELGWPLGPIAAAAIGAQGFAQVASIRSQSFGGDGAGAAATGSNTTAVNAASTPTAAGTAPAGGTLTVQGLSASSLFTGDAVSALAEELLAYQRRGGTVVLAG